MADQSLKIFATKLPQEWSDEQVREYFSAQGTVLEVSVFKDNNKSINHSGLGCAYIKFQSKTEAEEIIKNLSKEVSKPYLETIQKIQLRWADGEVERLKLTKEPTQKVATSKYIQYNSSDGRPYYLNTETGQTQWEAPIEMVQPYKAPPPSQGPPGCNLFLFHLPIEWREEDLIKYFSPFGNVISARIMCEKESGRSKGYGFISYDSKVSAVNAVKMMNGYQVLGKRLKVEIKKGEYLPEYVIYPSYQPNPL
ncbi:hypothetical protein SteCoe_10259 [Stentor coeruleus]|uniref:RNA-binding protein n=1 Tax=Stentor coeruleus TaxID=5963 RepID=A0A1R2CFX7_9CILI|nr:hypothetical protein SteCoe_10259 [Stentor coeruleus]